MSELAAQHGQEISICALVLAGGAGRRVNGRDKGLIYWQGKRLIEHVVERIRPQVSDICISCNRNRATYGSIAPIAPTDLRSGFQGPLAGLEAARATLTADYVLLAPCDTPQLPHDLVLRLHTELKDNPCSQVCYARSNNQDQYLCALMHRSALTSLSACLDEGQRAVRQWYATMEATTVEFSDQGAAFLNLNELTEHEDRQSAGPD